MFPDRYFGPWYFGNTYFGPAEMNGGGTGGGAQAPVTTWIGRLISGRL